MFKPLGVAEVDNDLKHLLRLIAGSNDELGLQNVTLMPAGFVLGMAVQTGFSNTPTDLHEFDDPDDEVPASS
jgi:hypothetical protein